jgi:hypothetical protein
MVKGKKKKEQTSIADLKKLAKLEVQKEVPPVVKEKTEGIKTEVIEIGDVGNDKPIQIVEKKQDPMPEIKLHTEMELIVEKNDEIVEKTSPPPPLEIEKSGTIDLSEHTVTFIVERGSQTDFESDPRYIQLIRELNTALVKIIYCKINDIDSKFAELTETDVVISFGTPTFDNTVLKNIMENKMQCYYGKYKNFKSVKIVYKEKMLAEVRCEGGKNGPNKKYFLDSSSVLVGGPGSSPGWAWVNSWFNSLTGMQSIKCWRDDISVKEHKTHQMHISLNEPMLHVSWGQNNGFDCSTLRLSVGNGGFVQLDEKKIGETPVTFKIAGTIKYLI